MSSSNCCFLACIQISQKSGQVVSYSHLSKNFQQFIVIHTVKGFGIVNEAEIDVFLELSCFFDDPVDVGNLVSGIIVNMPANMENSAVATGLEKVSFHSNPKEGNAKECWNYCTIALISHTSKVMLKILQARLQQYMNRELPDVQAGFRKGRGTRDQIANIRWIIEKAREGQKNIYFCFIDYAKAFDYVDHNKLWKILKEMGIPDHLICL